MNAATCAVFFASGAAALLFETLWFRQTGLVLGNTVWASALVTAGFMAGLATGNSIAMRVGYRLARPLRLFAGLELVVGVTGAGLVLAMPAVGRALAPLLSRLEGSAGLDALRLACTLALLVVPATAMGATLPVLARSLGSRDPIFGRLLGRLYGWNTLGAVAGALLGEGLLIRWLGVPRTALFAAGLDLLAAGTALVLDRRLSPIAPTPRPEAAPAGRAPRILAAAFLAGFLLLALEVVWFRFLLMFVWGTSEAFAVMLAVVLLGIGAGGLFASAWLGRRPGDRQHAATVALVAGALTVASYATFEHVLRPLGGGALGTPGTTLASLWLMLPVSVASGALFTLLGHALRAEAAEDAQAAGVLTLANTLGAMLGALVAGFVLLPLVGMEISFFALACAYGAVAALALPATSEGRSRPALAAALAFAASLVLFPFGALRGPYVGRIDAYWRGLDGSRVVAVKEGLSETVFLLRHERLGQPYSWRMLTNGTSMSTTDFESRRYMGLFVWLPAALHPGPRRALLISYGLGNTARTLTATAGLERLDVVDVSPDVLRLSPIVWPEPGQNPLRDARVRVHIEDARFFLLASRERYDLITGEPPPPKSAGIVNLYSREYFGLMRERLAEGGIASYWLPVLQLEPRETFAVTSAFCAAFADCSLWTGWGHEWLLLGTRGALAAPSAEHFARQWSDPVTAPRLKAAGFESPAQLGATFLAAAPTLAPLRAGVAPLVDDYPYRVDPRRMSLNPSPEYAELMDTGAARERFRASAFVRRHWPASWAEATLPAFDAQRRINRLAWTAERVMPPGGLDGQAEALAGGGGTVALWALGTSAEEQELAERAAASGASGPQLSEVLGLGALGRREWARAEALLSLAEPHAPHAARLRRWRVLAAALGDDRAGAARLLADSAALVEADRSTAAAADWQWLAGRLGVDLPKK